MKPKHFIELGRAVGDELPPLLSRIRDNVDAALEKVAKADDDGKGKPKVYYAIASTAAIDRDDEILIPKGVDVRHFETNPVMLHIHNYRQVPAGKVHQLDVDEQAVGMAYSFAEGTPAGDELAYLYDNDFMRAFSVGFIPRGIVRVDEQTPNKIDIDVRAAGLFDCKETGKLRVVKGGFFDEFDCRVPKDNSEDTEFVELKEGETFLVADRIVGKDGEGKDNPHKVSIDLSKYERRPRAIIAKWELLEISPVPIGSNPEALIQRMVGGLIRKYHDQPAKLAAAKQLAIASIERMIEAMEATAKETGEIDIRNAVPQHTTPIDMEGEWTPDAARASVARWASEDGSGNKDALDWGKFSQAFAWYDGENTAAFTSYKLLHHTIDEETGLTANMAGIRSAMAALLAERVDVGGDQLAVYEHLARHYRDAGQEVPPFERDYTDEEIKAIEDGTFETDEEKGPVATHSTPIDTEAAWNGPAARGQLRRWASSDDSGDPEAIDWTKFARGFAYFDSENRETVGAYSLPHHEIRDGELVAIWRGVTAAMGALLGARGATSIPEDERAAVHAHLARHYRDNDREAPPLAREFTEGELKAIAFDVLQFQKGEGDELKEVEIETDLDALDLDELLVGMFYADEKAVVRTGVVNGHSHSVDNMRTGNTSTENGHAHPYTAGASRTGPGGSDNHVHPVPNQGGQNAVNDAELHSKVERLAKQIDELEAEFSVRLGILHNMLDEGIENILDQLGDGEGGGRRSPKPSDGGSSAGDGDDPEGSGQNEPDEESIDRGVVALQDFLKEA